MQKKINESSSEVQWEKKKKHERGMRRVDGDGVAFGVRRVARKTGGKKAPQITLDS